MDTYEMLKNKLITRHGEWEVEFIETTLDIRRVGSANNKFIEEVAQPKREELFLKLRMVRKDMEYLGIPFEMKVDNGGTFHPRQSLVSLVGASDQERSRQIKSLVLSGSILDFVLEGDNDTVLHARDVFAASSNGSGFSEFDVVSGDNVVTRVSANNVRHVVVKPLETWSCDATGKESE